MKAALKDAFLLHVTQVARKYPGVRRCLLFGSRAKGDNKLEADYDIAVDWNDQENSNWGSFANEIVEEKPVLNTVDLVRLDVASEALQQKIKQEGLLFYEKS